VDSTFTWSKRLISIDPQNSWAYLHLGSAYVCIDSLDRAQWAYQKCQNLNPNIIINLYRLVHVYRLKGLYREAIEVLKQILEINTGEISAHYNLGLNYQLMGDTIAAQKHYSEYLNFTQNRIEKNPDDAAAYLSLGVTLTRLGKKDSGRQQGLQGIELDSTLHLDNVAFYTVLGENEEALKQLEKLISQGYKNFVWLKLHPDLHSLYKENKFLNLVNKAIEEN
jgi:tetratricopeptide (TPR) repeat protein